MTNRQSSATIDTETLKVDTDELQDSERLLHNWPKFFLLSTHLTADEVNDYEEQLELAGGEVTYDVTEAGIIMTVVNSPRRVRFELQIRKLKFEVHESPTDTALGKRKRDSVASPDDTAQTKGIDTIVANSGRIAELAPGHFLVVKMDWLTQSLERVRLFDVQQYVVLQGNLVLPEEKPSANLPVRQSTFSEGRSTPKTKKSDLQTHSSPLRAASTYEPHTKSHGYRRSAGPTVTRHLFHETTSEHDAALLKNLPDPPQWVKENRIYACERAASLKGPNEAFIELLKKIRLVRTLILDEIGVRAYSTSIASIAAYPYALIDPREILQLPGCEQKIAILFQEYQTTGQIDESKAIEKDQALKVIETFFNIWGVGAKTAREFYFDKGWRDTDDIIQHGWNSLTRVQQIWLKYSDEFEKKIPRSEVEFIASVVTYHAKQVVDETISCTIVGGYRRGKLESGDVDIIISHPRENGTLYLIKRLVTVLEKSKWITHTLTLSETNSARNQEPLNLKADPARKGGGFDTLDKALVVWQDPGWANKEADLSRNPKAKNPNVHRRVDIIISPWRTVGCAVAGWTSGTTFQRDLRRYAKARNGWKFDSSGCRDRATGRWLDLEKYTDEATRAKTPLEAERRVFEGLGLDWIDPEMRCSG